MVGLLDEGVRVPERAEHRIHVRVVRDVVAVVPQRRGIKGQQPDRVDAEVLQVRKLFHKTAEVATAIAIAVAEGADVELVDEGVLVPERIVVKAQRFELAPFRGRLYQRKYSKSCSLRRRRRKRKIWAGMACGLIST